MNNTAKIGAAVASGYLMGRSKKAKLAFAVGTWMMGRRLSLDVRKLAREGLSQLASSPEVAKLTDEVRQELLGAGRAAATSMLTGQAEKIADSLARRTAALSGAGEEPSEEEPEEGEEPEKEEPEEEEPEEEGAGRAQGEAKEAKQPKPPKRVGRAEEKAEGTGERPRRPSQRVRHRPSAQEPERPARRAGSGRRLATSDDTARRRPRPDPERTGRQSPAKTARTRRTGGS